MTSGYCKVVRVIYASDLINLSLSLDAHKTLRSYIALNIPRKPNLDLLIKLAASEEQLRVISDSQSIDRILMLEESSDQSARWSPHLQASVGMAQCVEVLSVHSYGDLHGFCSRIELGCVLRELTRELHREYRADGDRLGLEINEVAQVLVLREVVLEVIGDQTQGLQDAVSFEVQMALIDRLDFGIQAIIQTFYRACRNIIKRDVVCQEILLTFYQFVFLGFLHGKVKPATSIDLSLEHGLLERGTG